MLIEVKVPVLPESVSEATILGWEKKAGELVRQGEKLAELETDKVVLEVVAPEDGMLSAILKKEASNVVSDEAIAQLHTDVDMEGLSAEQNAEKEGETAGEPQAEADAVRPETGAEKQPPPEGSPKTGPSARKYAAEMNIDPARVEREGERLTRADLERHARREQTETETVSRPPSSPDASRTAGVAEDRVGDGARPAQRVPMTRLRRRAAERLLQAQQQHAILTTFNEVNMHAVMETRKRHKEGFEQTHGVKLGLMSFFVKAAVAALQRFPVINASIDGEDVLYHGYYDIGIAVSSPRGLVVPVLRDVDQLSFADIEKGIAEFGKRAKDGNLKLEDLEGGTFTITNGGVFGSMLSTPILNPPQSAILGMHNIVERPVAENGQVVIRPVMYLALSYDHRLVDGRDAVQFLVAIKQAVEDPARLLLGV